ncbi:hypothetical protein DL771_009083 [Monosporascus sp. 5C6A]|nr:hypothetical protein DL771_009083 [Monosporascus sp. 5C6A]
MSGSQRGASGLEALLHRPRPTAWQQFLRKPSRTPGWRCADPRRRPDTFKELEAAIAWLRGQRHPIKVSLDWGDIIYLEDEEATVTCPRNGRRLRVYGSPHSPRHGTWAFQHPREEDIWADGRVPAGIDVLITHGPPRAHLDLLNLGCVHLLRELWRVRPRLHVFGHIHEGAGTELVRLDSLQEAYERTVAAGGEVVNLMRTAIRFMGAFMGPAAEAKSLLVDASIVGGLCDQKRRKPVTVVI